jgi:hypothetical protein
LCKDHLLVLGGGGNRGTAPPPPLEFEACEEGRLFGVVAPDFPGIEMLKVWPSLSE